MDQKYDFPVKLTPVITKPYGVEVPKKLAVIRTDTKQALGIVSTKYELLEHDGVIEAFRRALKGTKHEERIQLAKNGAHLYTTYKLPAHTVEVRKGDAVALQFTVRNSYDGTNALQIALGAFRLVCSNGLVIGRSYFSWSQRHIGAGKDIDHDAIAENIQNLISQFKKTLPHLQAMSRNAVAATDKLFDPKAVNLPTYLLEEASASYQKDADKTTWGYYNALTAAITHRMKKENPRQVVRFGRIAWKAAELTMTK